MKELAKMLLDRLAQRHVEYADVRVAHRTRETLRVRNAHPEVACSCETFGYGVRVRKNGCWGFAACSDVTSHLLDEAVERALLSAEASMPAGNTQPFSPPAAVQGHYATPFQRDPFVVPLNERMSMLLECTQVMTREKLVRHAEARMEALREHRVFASTAGSMICQEFLACGAALRACAVEGGQMQLRSYPGSEQGNLAAAGYEFIEALGLREHAARVAQEAVQLLRAPVCPTLTSDVILDASQLSRHLAQSVAHALELDRILGRETSLDGPSFLEPSMLGSLRIASPEVHVEADSTLPLGLGTFAYDDEGVAAQRDVLIREGVVVGALSSCSTAPAIGRSSNGSSRAESWAHLPMVRLSNLTLEAGKWDVEELIADTKRGFLLETGKGGAVDGRGSGFEYATQVAREIRSGKLGKLYKNPVYSGTTLRFWNACDAICSERHRQLWAVGDLAKGNPAQSVGVSVACAPARFRRVSLHGF